MIFVWNGKQANPFIKSIALMRAFDLESIINKGGEVLLQIFFSGGVIRNKKLQKGKIIQLNSTSSKPPNKELEREIRSMSETIFLFRFLFPVKHEEEEGGGEEEGQRFNEFINFSNTFLNELENKENQAYELKFIKFNQSAS